MEDSLIYFENLFEQAREKGYEKGYEIGFEIGKSREKVATAKRMAKKNMPLSDIAEFTDLSVEEVQKIIER